MISVTSIILVTLAIVAGGAVTLAWALCQMSAMQEREAERQQLRAWRARQDDPEARA